MKIYSPTSSVLLDIDVDDGSYRYRSIMGDHKVVLNFSLAESVEVPVGSYIDFQGQRYTLFRPENLTKNGTRKFDYEVTFGSNQELLKQYKYKFLSTKPHKLKFPLTAKPSLFLDLLVKNLNLNDPGWVAGSCLEAPEKDLSFNHEDCFSVLGRLASEFDTEWEITGKTIHLRKVEHNKENPLPLSYGKGNGFRTGVGRSIHGERKPVTRLYVQGGERNIDSQNYGSETLLLPKSQSLTYEGRTYKTDVFGMYIQRADKAISVIVEDSYDGSAFYPKYVGKVSGVETVEGKDDKDHPVTFYNIIDNGIPDSLNFSEYNIPTEKATLIFQSGMLTGKEFEIKTDDKGNLSGYDSEKKMFELVSNQTEGGLMPNATFCPKPGDTYAVFHIKMPQAYICDDATQTGASWDMFREAVRYLYESEEEVFTFTGELDPIWASKNWLAVGGKILPGSYILFSDPQFQPDGVKIRITGVTDSINRPHQPTLELSNAPVAGFLSNELNKIKAEEVVNEQKFNQLLSFTKRRYEDAKEAQGMLEKAFENFSPGIDPIWVRTMSVLIGNEYQQFEFVNNKSESQQEVIPAFEMNNNTRLFSVPASILKHMTMGIENTSSVHKASDYKYWDIREYISPYLSIETDSYYLVARCDKSGSEGVFLLQKDYNYDPGDGFWYFLVGLLSSETHGERSFATAYGYTEILPGQMRIKNIISPDGKTYFNVSEGVIGGNIRIMAGSTGYDNLEDKPNLNEYTLKSEFSVLSDRVTANVQQITTVNERVTSIENAGFITTAQGSSLYASKTMENGATIVSKINQTPYYVTIDANKINLYGAVTYQMLNPGLKNELDAKLESGEIGLSDLNATLQYKINTMSSDIASKVNSSALKAFALNSGPGVSKADFQSALQTEFNAKLTGSSTVSNNKLVNVIVNGETLIAGGYIQAQYINVDDLTVNNVANVGDWKIDHGRMIWKDNPTTVYGNPVGTWIDATGFMRLLSPNRNSSILLSAYDDGYVIADLKREESGEFIKCRFSSGSSWRLFSISAEPGTGDSSWYNRFFIKISHLPFSANLASKPTISNSIGNGTYALRWDARTGYIYVQ